MERRNYLKLIGSSLILSQIANIELSSQTENTNRRLNKPKKLNKGDKVAIIAPSSAVSSPDNIYKAREIIEYFGLVPIFGKNLLNGSGYKTRSKSERIEDIHWAFSDKSIKAVFCIRGGYGSASLLDLIDFDLIKKNPKIFCGYSDITALHLGINKYSNLVTFHGPVMLSSFDSLTLESFNKIFFENEMPIYQNPISKNLRNNFQTYTINPGEAEGEIIGGNLSILCSLMGTPFEPDLKNKILFIEDVGEEPYRIHRMLVQLHLSGLLKNIAGLIIGKCSDCNKNSGLTWDMSELEVIYDIVTNYKFPCFYGLLIGHTSNQFTIPLGINVRINSNSAVLELLEKSLVD